MEITSAVQKKYWEATVEKNIQLNQSPNKKCWRCVIIKGKVAHFFESEGVTRTKWEMFCGGKTECLEEIERRGMVLPKEEELPTGNTELNVKEKG